MLLFRPPLQRFGRPGVTPPNFAAAGDEPSPLANDLPSLADRTQAEWLWVLLSPLPASGTTHINDAGAYALVDPADGTYTQQYRGLVMPLAGTPQVYVATITVDVGDAEPPAYAFTPAGLSLPLQLGAAVWTYTPPAPGAYAFAPDGLAVPVQVGTVAWAYTPPAGGAYMFTPVGLSLPLQLGSIAWSYTPPPSGDRVYVRLPAGRRPDCRVHYMVVSPPMAPVLPLDLLHTHLRLGLQPGDTHPEDAMYLGALASARSLAQHHTGRAIGQQTIEVRIDAFPAGPIELPIGPAVAVLSVTYAAEVDGAFVETTMPPGDYVLHTHDAQAHLYAVDGWPAAARVVGAVTVRYLAGDMPDAVRQALLLVVGHYARHRQAVTDRQTSLLLLGVEALFDVDKVWGF